MVSLDVDIIPLSSRSQLCKFVVPLRDLPRDQEYCISRGMRLKPTT